MTKNATIAPVARPRGSLTPEEIATLEQLRGNSDEGQAAYRAGVVAVLVRGASFAEVSKATGLSTNTLQRWRRESSR